jgi:glucose/arabinose dehydrogenase
MKRSASLAVALILLVGCGANADQAEPTTSQSPDTSSTSTVDEISTTTTASTSSSNAVPRTTTVPGTTVVGSGAVAYSTKVVGQLEAVVDLTQRDSTDAFFYVVSRNGTIERWRTNGTRIDTVLDISASTTGEGERGLLGLAFRRNVNKWEAFINFTNLAGNTVISRFDVSEDGTFQMGSSATGTTILSINQPYSNHNGGAVVVGPDNMLYIGMGDGGSANDPERRALDTSQLLGKILRINPRTNGYDIPVNNPYTNVAGARAEIWAIGVRNPWRFNFDTFGNIWIADVGQNQWEEVSVGRGTKKVPGGRGASFGWSAYEGLHRFNEDATSPNSVRPVFEYEHKNGACSISGSAIGTNTITPGRAGWYFFGDYCTGEVTALLTDGTSTVATEIAATEMGNITAVRSTTEAMFVLSVDGMVRQLISTRK